MTVSADTLDAAVRRALALDQPSDQVRADARRADAVDRLLDAARRAMSEDRNELAVLLCLAAARRSPGAEARVDELAASALAQVRCMRVIPQAHLGGAYSVVWSPDSAMLASAGADGRVKLWSGDEFEPIAALEGHQDRVRRVEFNRVFPLISSCGDDGATVVWNAATHAPLWRAHGRDASALAARFSPCGRWIAIAASPGCSGLLDARTGRVAFDFARHDGVIVYDAVFSSDGRLVSTCGDDGRAIVWRVADGEIVRELCHDRPVRSVAFDTANERIAVASYEGAFTILQLDNGAHTTFGSPRGRGHAARFVDEDRALWVVGEGGAQALIPLTTGQPGEPILVEPHNAQIDAVCVRRDGLTLAAASRDGATKVTVLNGGRAHELCVLRSAGAATCDVDLTWDAGCAATADADGSLRIWSLDPLNASIGKGGEPLRAAASWLRRSGRAPTRAELEALGVDVSAAIAP